MPQISLFYGIIILMNFADHAPAHFHLWFNNDVNEVVDLRSSLNGVVFEPLKDLDYFKRFAVRYNTVEWDNGADFAPEYLLALPEA